MIETLKNGAPKTDNKTRKKILFSDFFRRKKSTASILDNIIIEAQCEFKVNSTSKCKNFLEYINTIKKESLLKQISLVSYEITEGKKTQKDLDALIGELSKPIIEEKEDRFVSSNLNSLISHCIKTPGLRWRLNSLNLSLGSLRKGDFGFIFARPETGKTTFLASEGSFFAQQAKEQKLGPGVWCNNEEQNEKVKVRQFQAALGVTMQELMSDPDKWQEEYNALIGSHLLIPNQTSYTKRDIELLCEEIHPSFLIIDQIDKIEGFKADREDLLLGSIYQWARELAKEYCPIIAVCQADGSGENVKYLTMANVANAKTAKQAEADWILGIGKIHDPGWGNVRFINISKNKLFGDEDTDPARKHDRFQVLIEPLTARYKDI